MTGDFVAFVTALFMMYAPAKKLSRVNANIQQALAASERIFAILDTHSEVEDRPGAPPMAPLRRVIEFRDVQFTYGGAEGATLDGVNVIVPAGRMLAIVGRSGAGKTTLVNLLPRLRRDRRSILIDGADIRDVTLASLRAQIGIVTQETSSSTTPSRPTSPSDVRPPRWPTSKRRRALPTRTSSSSGLTTATTRRSASAASACRAASGSGWRLPGRCCAIPRS
jgi:ABC-type glutathione transport system ATPase component